MKMDSAEGFVDLGRLENISAASDEVGNFSELSIIPEWSCISACVQTFEYCVQTVFFC